MNLRHTTENVPPLAERSLRPFGGHGLRPRRTFSYVSGKVVAKFLKLSHPLCYFVLKEFKMKKKIIVKTSLLVFILALVAVIGFSCKKKDHSKDIHKLIETANSYIKQGKQKELDALFNTKRKCMTCVYTAMTMALNFRKMVPVKLWLTNLKVAEDGKTATGLINGSKGKPASAKFINKDEKWLID